MILLDTDRLTILSFVDSPRELIELTNSRRLTERRCPMTQKLLAYGLLFVPIGLGLATTVTGLLACPLQSLALQRAFVYLTMATVVCAVAAADRLSTLPIANRSVLWIGCGLAPLLLLWVVLLVVLQLPVQKVRESSARGQMINNGKQIVIAMHGFHDNHKHFPVDVRHAGNPILSWRVSILPFVEQPRLHAEFDQAQAWDSPRNGPLLDKMPSTYHSVLFHETAGHTPWQGFVGPGTAFEPGDAGLKLKDDFPDGLSNTILFVEAQQHVPWSKPADIPYGPGIPLPPLGHPFPQKGEWPFCCPVKGSPRFMACMADGTVRMMSGDTSEDVLRALIVRNDGKGAGLLD